MMQAYSRLKRLLGERNITVPELHKRIQQRGMHVNLKSLYRLSREHQPLERLDLRVSGAVCQVCEVPLSELMTFEIPKGTLHRLSVAEPKRLDTLMTKNNAGQLTGGEREEPPA
jgi:Cro/C1-type HTH DNA-binding domain